MLELLSDMDQLLSGHEGFLLGPWLESAKNYGNEEFEKELYLYNAKLQITIWGTTTSSSNVSEGKVAGDTELSDYANKQWSGLISTFYKQR